MFMSRVRDALRFLGARSSKVTRAIRLLAEKNQTSLDHALQADEDAQATAVGIEEISDHITMIAASAEEFSINMQEVQRSVRDSQANIAAVSRATGDLATASVEVAGGTDEARQVTEEAVDSVEQARSLVVGLEDAATEISKLTTVINDISEQTKVLALNATIEAARAGEAGRGFSVVARDVKELATETREASAVISARVAGIETTIHDTIASINGVANVIKGVQEVVGRIATAAETQSTSAQGIADNIGGASENFEAITHAIDEGQVATLDITRRLADSSEKAGLAKDSSQRAATAARQIARDVTVSYATTLEIAAEQEEIMARVADAQVPLADDGEEVSGLIQFSPRFSVRVDDMDADHQKIFDYVNQVHAQVMSGAPEAETAATFKAMAEFTADHFAREEAIMDEHAYPDVAQHKAIHRELLATVGDYARALDRGEKVNLIGALSFLNDWLKGHILEVDRGYGDYYASKGIRAAARGSVRAA